MPRPIIALASLCLATAAIALWAYLPGLHGDFLFDDYANLPALGNQGPVTSWSVFWRYITSGVADPTGRPLTLLTFLLDARDWPASPYPFKRTNLVIHLINGVLLGVLLHRLGRFVEAAASESKDSDARPRLAFAAVLGAAFWLLHPLFVSTTLYIVQREAMLPVTFTLLGMLFWLRGRSRLWQGHSRSGLVWMATGLLGCTAVATLSKANGILLPSLVLVVEYMLLRPLDRHMSRLGPMAARHADAQQLNGRALALLAWPTAIAVAVYLVHEGWRGMYGAPSSIRPWTLPQRLLTEPRVLWDYLKLLWIPRPFTPGVFNDQIQASSSLLSPASTLFALLGLCGLAAAAWTFRRRWPLFALAVFFYLVGQVLESSTIALELFFEHRNYLPSLLMFWPLALWLCGIRIHFSTESAPSRWPVCLGVRNRGQHDVAAGVLAGTLLIGLSLMTYARAVLWGNSRDQALLWATLNPSSPRAQAYAAQTEMAAGDPDAAARRLQKALSQAPNEMQLALNLLAARCQAGHLDPATLEMASRALATAHDSGSLLANWFQRMIAEAAHPACHQLDTAAIGRLLAAARANPLLAAEPGRRQDLYSLQGQLSLAVGDPTGALDWFKRALDQQVRATTAFKQAALLATAGYPEGAIAELDYYQAIRKAEAQPGLGMPHLHAWVLARQHYWDTELMHLRNTLLADQRAQGGPTR